MMKRQIFPLFFALIVLLSAVYVQAQKSEESPTEFIQYNANSCETNNIRSHQLAIDALTNGERVFIIVRAGTGETDKVNNHRFQMVRNFFRDSKNWKGDTFVYAIGEKAKGQGRIEFYLGSKLVFVALAKRGKVPCLDCCGYDFDKGIF